MAVRTRRRSLSVYVAAAAVLIIVQSVIGLILDLSNISPDASAGSDGVVMGWLHSVGWAVRDGALSLQIHTVLGLALALVVIRVIADAIMLRHRPLLTWSLVGAALVIGAGLNGASFLAFNMDVDSVLMYLSAFGAVLCYLTMLYLLTVHRHAQATT